MSFGVYIDDGDVEYAGSGLNTLFAQRRNLARPAHWKMLGEILRFNSLSFASSSSGKAASAAVQLQICFIRSASVRLSVITTCCRWPQQSGHARPGPCLVSPSRALPISSGTTGCLICAIDPNGTPYAAAVANMPGACWHPDSLNPMMALRVVRANGWWDEFWEDRTARLLAA